MLPRFFYMPLLLTVLAAVTFGIGVMVGLGVLGPALSPKTTAHINSAGKAKIGAKSEPVEAVGTKAPSPIYPANPTGVQPAEAATTQSDDKSTQASPQPQDREAQRNESAPASASCDVSACASAYRSFRESDCTYQPFSGPRRICEKTGGEAAFASEPRKRKQPTTHGRRAGARALDDDAPAVGDEPDIDDMPPARARRYFLINPDDDF